MLKGVISCVYVCGWVGIFMEPPMTKSNTREIDSAILYKYNISESHREVKCANNYENNAGC